VLGIIRDLIGMLVSGVAGANATHGDKDAIHTIDKAKSIFFFMGATILFVFFGVSNLFVKRIQFLYRFISQLIN